MKLNPQQAPLYGECLLTVQLCDEEHFEEEEDVEFYLLFSGTTQRHLTSTLRISHVTLQAICPAHDCCESVRVTLCSARPGRDVDTVSEEHFQFVQDLAFDMAQFLVSTAGQDDGLEGAMMLDECQIPLQECERLDESLALALRHLTLPQGWSVLGTDLGKNTAPVPQETLLHFAARRGLRRVAIFLLQQPGGHEALRVPNKQGAVPANVAQRKGHFHLQQLLTPEETTPWTTTEASLKTSEGRVVRHHPRLNTYTLTVATTPGTCSSSLQEDVEELRHLIRRHAEKKGAPLLQPQSQSELQECGDCLETVTEQACLDQLQRDSLHAAEQRSEEDEAQRVDQPSQAGGCWKEAGPAPGPHTSEPPSGDGCVGESVRPCKNSDTDFPAGEEGGVELSCSLTPLGDCGKASDKSDTAQSGQSLGLRVPSCGKQQEEADTVGGVISAAQGVDRESQEGERGEERVADRAPTEADMGQAPSQERLEGADEYKVGHERTQEAEQEGEKAPEALSGGGREGEFESEEPLFGTVFTENGEKMQDVKAGPESLCDASPQPIPRETGPKSDSELIQETLEVDCSLENEQAVSEENSFETPPHNVHCGESHSDSVTETGSVSDGAKNSAESLLIAEAEPSWLERAEERLVPAQQEESSSMDVGSPKPDTVPPADDQPTYTAQGSEEPGDSKAEPILHTELTTADTCQQESQSSAFQSHTESTESPASQNGITSSSCSQEAGSSTEEGAGAGDVSLGELVPSSEEDPHLSVSCSIAEPSPLPEVTTLTPPTQEVHSLGQENGAVTSEMDESITQSHSDGTGPAQQEEEGGDAQIPSNTEPNPPSSPHEDMMVVLQPDSSPGLPSAEPESDGPLRAPLGQGEETQESEGSGPKPETQDHVLGSNCSDPQPATPSSILEAVIHKEEPPLPETHTEEKEVVEWTHEEKGDGQYAQEHGPEVPESGVTAEVVSVNGGDSGSESLPTTLEESTEDTLEQTAVSPSQEGMIESAEGTGGNLTSGEIIASSVGHDDSTEDDITVFVRTLETTPEEPDLQSPAAPVNFDLMNPDMAGVISPKDPTHNLTPGLERVEEESEETGESKSTSEELSDMREETEALPARDVVDGRRESASGEPTDTGDKINREKDTFYSIDPCGAPNLLEQKPIPECPEFPLSPTAGRSVSSTLSDADGFFIADTGEDSVFRKAEEPVTGDSTSEVSVSCSSTDDTASLGPPSCTPDSCVEAGRRWSAEEARPLGAAGGGEAEEEKDRLTEVPVRSGLLRSSGRSLSPFRRHSWGPGKNPAGEAEMNQRSSLRSLGEGKPTYHRRSMSWCPSEVPPSPDPDEISSRSYSLEGLTADRPGGKESPPQRASPRDPRRIPRQESEERGSLVSLTEEEQESDLGECSSLDSQISGGFRSVRHSSQSMTLPLTKSVSMLTISQKELDAMGRPRPKRRISFSFSISPILPKSKTVFSIGSSSSDEEEEACKRSFSGSLGNSISEEDPGPLRSDCEGKGVSRGVSRTFSYLRSKMYKKTKEKDKDRSKDKEAKEREKRTLNGHLFSPVNPTFLVPCYQCNKAINTKDASYCTNCYAHVHKGCKDILPVCAKVKMKQKQQAVVTDSATMPAVTLRSKSTPSRERPWSAMSVPDDPALSMGPRRHTSIMAFNSSNLSKSMSISNIAGPVFDEMPLKSLRYLSQSTDSLHKTSKVNESTESLTDEGTEMMDSQLMGEFEADSKELEADSWSLTQDKKFLKQLKKDIIKRQDVIYELIQTEMHHVRTLKIMADVYSKGLLKEMQLEAKTVEQVFPVLDDLLDLHTSFFSHMLERRRGAQQEGKDGGFVIRKIGDVLLTQFSGSNAERMKKVYGKFCSRHNEAVNVYKDLHTRDKRFQAFIKKKMSSTIVRRLGIPECILMVTQRITKYPVILQRILQHTKENEEDHRGVSEALRLVKELITAVDSKVNEHEKKRRLKEVYSRTDSKSIMRMKSGQMFAREDLVRGRKLLHDGTLQLKNATGRLKEVQALLLSDIFVFLQEKDQKYVFASLDQRSTVISLQKLIVREVANEEKGLFLITAGIAQPEMVEVHASSKEERNTWMQLIQDAMQSIDKDEDEGIPSETEEDKRLLETKAKEMRDRLQKKDEQIVALLEEKVKLFRDMCDCGPAEEASPMSRTLFRASAHDMPKGEPIIKDALKEVETLQTLVNGSLGGAMGQLETASGGVGPVCLPRRAETFGGFDSHQMNISKNGEKDEGEDSADLRRTESDSVLKKGGNANLLLLLKRNSEQVLHSVTHLHDLLNTLQAVVVQQDSFIEDQRQALSERPPSRPPSRPSSLIEQEKQRSLEKQRQEAANLQRQQAAHAEERRRREREWEAREHSLGDREALLVTEEEEAHRRRRELEEERQELQSRKEEYQRDLERLRDAQKRLERDREQVRRELERMEQNRLTEEKGMCRTPSTTSEDSLLFQSSSSLDRDMGECELSSSPRKDSLIRLNSKRKGKNFGPFTSSASQKAQSGEAQNQLPNRLMQLAKTKDKKEKKKKKGKGQQAQGPESSHLPVSDQPLDGEIFFC
ncbi:A-kinase anchor protein 13 isoform X2 [Conger conger]|uniref:A-kinase anchor protein 13 isoform X2 n=1 Tax=Conger conger TaxID=82655 RepID=UPI002A5A451A|nr:A-kinase anchor protein 13 isoform X2 [Conger conger]